MKKMNFTRWLVVLFACTFFACNDKEDPIRLYTLNELRMPQYYTTFYMNVGFTTLNVEGGDGEFTANSLDDKIVKAEMKDDVLYLTGMQPGEASVTVMDNSGTTASLTVTVSERKSSMYISEQRMDIELEVDGTFTGSEEELEEFLAAKKEEVTKWIRERVAPVGTVYKMTQSSYDQSGWDLEVTHKEDDSYLKKGTFRTEYSDGVSYVIFEYDGMKYRHEIMGSPSKAVLNISERYLWNDFAAELPPLEGVTVIKAICRQMVLY